MYEKTGFLAAPSLTVNVLSDIHGFLCITAMVPDDFFFLVIVTVLWHLCSVSAFVFVDGLPSDVTFACLSLTQFCFFFGYIVSACFSDHVDCKLYRDFSDFSFREAV